MPKKKPTEESDIKTPVRVGGKILVTGANGQLGKELKDISSQFHQFEFVFLSREDLPIHYFELVRNFFKTIRPQFCINCAAYTNVDRAEQEKQKVFQVNAEAVGLLAAVCKEYDTKLIHISTDYVFDGTATTPYKEEFAPHPINVYGASKWEGEKQALQLNPEIIIIRSSWIYSSYGKNFVRTMTRLMNEKNEVSVVNDQVGSPTYSADLAEVVMRIIVNSQLKIENLPAGRQGWIPGIYHFSNEGIISWYDFALAIKEITGSSCIIKPISTVEFPTPAKRPLYSGLDKSKIKQVFRIKLKGWKESLKACIKKIQE